MSKRPSQPVLDIIRRVAKDKGMNTAALARKVEMPRAQLKHILAGSQPMTVDELILLTQALEMDVAAMAGMPADAVADDDDGDEAEAATPLRSLSQRDTPEFEVDPYGNHAEQFLKLGFSLGTDMFIRLKTSELQTSGIPRDVLARYAEDLPLTLDAAYHRHHDPRFLPEGLQVVLSFDSLYTCVLPWEAFVQITSLPLPPEPTDEPPEEVEPEAPEEPVFGRGHLRLV